MVVGLGRADLTPGQWPPEAVTSLTGPGTSHFAVISFWADPLYLGRPQLQGHILREVFPNHIRTKTDAPHHVATESFRVPVHPLGHGLSQAQRSSGRLSLPLRRLQGSPVPRAWCSVLLFSC